MSTFGFVILHYGDISVTERCVKSILELDRHEDGFVVIVDNDFGKDDNERDRLAEKFRFTDQVKVIKTYCDLGFSAANNLGYETIKKECVCDFIVIANNDIVFQQTDFISLVENSHTKSEWDVLSPDIVSVVNREHQSPLATRARTKRELVYTIAVNRLCYFLYPFVWPILKKTVGENEYKKIIPEIMKDIVPYGACIILSSRFVHAEEKVFYPETKFYYEEYILHSRCKRKGYLIVYTPDISVIHYCGSATQNRAGDEYKKIKFRLYNISKSAKVYLKYLCSTTDIDNNSMMYHE